MDVTSPMQGQGPGGYQGMSSHKGLAFPQIQSQSQYQPQSQSHSFNEPVQSQWKVPLPVSNHFPPLQTISGYPTDVVHSVNPYPMNPETSTPSGGNFSSPLSYSPTSIEDEEEEKPKKANSKRAKTKSLKDDANAKGRTASRQFRERQRQRVEELEAQIAQLQIEQRTIQNVMERAQHDNVNIRAQQSYLRSVITSALMDAYPEHPKDRLMQRSKTENVFG